VQHTPRNRFHIRQRLSQPGFNSRRFLFTHSLLPLATAARLHLN
jgi:hypothetical protein